MTLLETERTLEGLRDQVRVLRRMRLDGVDFAARRVSAPDDGGDFVEVVPLGQRRWLVAVGDVAGRGPEAQALAEEVRRHVAARAGTTRHLGDLLDSANALVQDLTGGEHLVSLVVFLLDGLHQTFRLANAGGVAPLAVGRGGGVVALEGHGPALGLLPDVSYREAGPMRLPPGMLVLVATDGVVEAVDREGHPFGRERASAVLAGARSHPPRVAVRRLLAEVARFGSPEEAADRTAAAFRFAQAAVPTSVP